MRMNGVMAVMAVVCVATVLGGELRLGPLAKFFLVAKDAENKHSDMASVEAAVVFGDDVVGQVLEAINPVRLPTGGLGTDDSGALPDVDTILQLGDPATAGGDRSIGSRGFLMGGLSAQSTLPVDTPASQSPPSPNLPGPLLATGLASPPAPAPEPATWAMMVCGIGGIGAALRRAKRQAGTGERDQGDAQLV